MKLQSFCSHRNALYCVLNGDILATFHLSAVCIMSLSIVLTCILEKRTGHEISTIRFLWRTLVGSKSEHVLFEEQEQVINFELITPESESCPARTFELTVRSLPFYNSF